MLPAQLMINLGRIMLSGQSESIARTIDIHFGQAERPLLKRG